MADRSREIVITVICGALLFSLGGSAALVLKLREAEARIERAERVATALDQAKDGLVKTLAECNNALASVQAKPAPVCPAPLPVPPPVICPAPPPAPVCPAAPTCPPIPVICPPAASCPEPAKIIAPVPAANHKHRRHYLHRSTPPECLKGEP